MMVIDSPETTPSVAIPETEGFDPYPEDVMMDDALRQQYKEGKLMALNDEQLLNILNTNAAYKEAMLVGDIYKQALNNDRTPCHVPFHNWMGPNTNVPKQLIDQVEPVDGADLLSLEHDFNYYKAKTVEDIRKADQIFYEKSTNLEQELASMALMIKSTLGFDSGFVSKQPPSKEELDILNKQFGKILSRYGSGGANNGW